MMVSKGISSKERGSLSIALGTALALGMVSLSLAHMKSKTNDLAVVRKDIQSEKVRQISGVLDRITSNLLQSEKIKMERTTVGGTSELRVTVGPNQTSTFGLGLTSGSTPSNPSNPSNPSTCNPSGQDSQFSRPEACDMITASGGLKLELQDRDCVYSGISCKQRPIDQRKITFVIKFTDTEAGSSAATATAKFFFQQPDSTLRFLTEKRVYIPGDS